MLENVETFKTEIIETKNVKGNETWTKITPHFKKWEQKLLPDVEEVVKPETSKNTHKILKNTFKKFIIPRKTKNNDQLIADKEKFKNERIIGRKIAKKFLCNKLCPHFQNILSLLFSSVQPFKFGSILMLEN
jgi:hypothetical protein